MMTACTRCLTCTCCIITRQLAPWSAIRVDSRPVLAQLASMPQMRLGSNSKHGALYVASHPCSFLASPTRPSSSTQVAQQAADARSCSYAVAPSIVSRQQQRTLGRHVARAGSMDVMPTWTLDQIAGLVFGGVMLASVLSYRQVDVFIAKQQRKHLGLCQECGGLYDAPTCTQKNCLMKQQAAAAQQQQQAQ